MVTIGAKAMAASTHDAEGLIDIGTVVADPTPVWYSPHPATELQLPDSV